MDNTNKVNRENEELVSTEEVSLTSNVSPDEHDKEANDSKKDRKGKSLRGCLIVGALVIVVAFWVLVFLGNIEKRIVEEEMNEAKTQVLVSADVLKEYPRVYRYSDADNKYVADSLILNVVSITGVYDFDNPNSITCMIGYEIEGREYRLFTLKVEADSLEKHYNQLLKYADDENVQAIDNLYAFLRRNCHIDYVENKHYKGFVFVYDGCPDELKREWFSIGDYKIPIPETMYLSNNTNYGINYDFVSKDNSKYAEIQVKYVYDDFSYFSDILDKGGKIPKEVESDFVSLAVVGPMNQNHMDVKKVYDADYLNIDGKNVLHVGVDHSFPELRHVDYYYFFLQNKWLGITVSYRISEASEWKSSIEASIIMMKRI